VITLPAPNNSFQRKLSRTTHILSTAEATEMASSRVCAMRKRLLVFLPVLLLTGCTAEDAAGVKIDLSQLNWQTAVIIALALLVSPGKIVGQLTGQLAKVPGLEKILRVLGVIRSPDGSPPVLTQAEVLEALVSIVNRMPQSPLRDEIAKLLTKAATAPEVPTDAK